MINEALPSMPVEILGMNSSAYAGAEFLLQKMKKKQKICLNLKKQCYKKKFLAKDKTTLFEKKK